MSSPRHRVMSNWVIHVDLDAFAMYDDEIVAIERNNADLYISFVNDIKYFPLSHVE